MFLNFFSTVLLAQDPQYEQEYMTTDENYDMGATGYYDSKTKYK